MLKLRLRGKGSGYKEGPDHKGTLLNLECTEQMHLCISSKYHSIYAKVCTIVETLIKQIVKEYETYCQQYNKNYKITNIVKFENNKPKYLDLNIHDSIDLEPLRDRDLDETTVNKLVEARNKARRALRFDEADRIRDLLRDKGVTLMDEKGRRGCAVEVTQWKFTNAKNNWLLQTLNL